MAAPKRGARPASRSRAASKSKAGGREAPEAITETAEVEIDLEDLQSFNESTNWMIFGPSGHGKTVLTGGAPNAVFMSTEKGVVSAKRTGSKAGLIRVPSWEHVVAGKKWADENLGPDNWLILDSLTKMQVLMIRWILRVIHEQNESRDLDIPAIQDHQKWQNYFMRFVDGLIDAPYNVIFTATAMIKEDEDGEDIVLPQIQGKDYAICNYVVSQMDIVSYYAVAPQKRRNDPQIRRLLSQPYPPYYAKDRFGALGKWWDVEEGDYTAIAQMIKEVEKAA